MPTVRPKERFFLAFIARVKVERGKNVGFTRCAQFPLFGGAFDFGAAAKPDEPLRPLFGRRLSRPNIGADGELGAGLFQATRRSPPKSGNVSTIVERVVV